MVSHVIGHPKIEFHKKIKDIEFRLNQPSNSNLRLESFIVTPTRYSVVADRRLTLDEWQTNHVLFTKEDNYSYIQKIFDVIL
jgi:hypothetical protein